MKPFDLAIIGGGPAGYTAAERGAARGLRVVLFEVRELGGVCLNEGCIPTKTLLYSAKTYTNTLAADKYGVRVEGIGFDYGRIAARKNKVVRKLVLGVAAKMNRHGIEVVREQAFIKKRTAEGFVVEAGDESYEAKNLLVATGAEAFIPPIAGVSGNDCVVTNREILALKELPASLVVIGGGVVGMEFACLFNALGVRVCVIEQMVEIMPGIDLELSAMLRDNLTKKGVSFHLSCRVDRVDGARVHFTDTNDDPHTVEGEKILVSAGRKPIVNGFGLENSGVELTAKKSIKTDSQMRTNVPGVWAAGDVTGRSMLAHTASRQAEVAINNMTNMPDEMHYEAIPSVVYTNPELASVGLTYDAARAEGLEVGELSLPMSYSGRFVAENERVEGVCKVVVNEADNRVLGVHILGGPAGEIIWGASVAIEQKMTLTELQRIIFPHPTVSEIIKETTFSE